MRIKKTMCHHILKDVVCDRHLFLGCSEKDSCKATICGLKSAVYFSDIKNSQLLAIGGIASQYEKI